MLDTYAALKRRAANNPELSNYLHHRFFLNPATHQVTRAALAFEDIQLPSINDEEMSKETFERGDNLVASLIHGQ